MAAGKTPDEIRKIIFKKFDVDGRVFNEPIENSKLFVLKYWLEKVEGPQGQVERFKLLQKGSFIRNEYDELLKKYQVDFRYVRFVDHLVYVSLKNIK